VITDKVLGTGYNGAVRMATNKNAENKQKFAVKAFKLSRLLGEKKVQMDSEIACFLSMDHPHIARLFDVYEARDTLYLVMECLEGGELFDRVTECTRYSEQDAAEATRQMLLALNYLHCHGIVHRDLKLENFLYDTRHGNHLMLIDFGFSKVWDPNIKMHHSCGTLAYVAPEVLQKNYTKQCDLWSLGVIAFILLCGYMPFSGSEEVQKTNILAGKYTLKKDRWSTVSKEALSFVQGLLEVNPRKRFSADVALEHPWIHKRHEMAGVEIDRGIVDGLRQFGQASKFRRCCMELMAWSLSNEERAPVREYFVSMDKSNQGTILLSEFKHVLMDKFHVPEDETLAAFEALDTNHDATIHYTDFLAAMVSTRVVMHDDLLKAAFRRFDTDSSGFITAANLRQVVGDHFGGAEPETLLSEADFLKDNRISYAEFVSYIRGTPLEIHQAEHISRSRRLLTWWKDNLFSSEFLSYFSGSHSNTHQGGEPLSRQTSRSSWSSAGSRLKKLKLKERQADVRSASKDSPGTRRDHILKKLTDGESSVGGGGGNGNNMIVRRQNGNGKCCVIS